MSWLGFISHRIVKELTILSLDNVIFLAFGLFIWRNNLNASLLFRHHMNADGKIIDHKNIRNTFSKSSVTSTMVDLVPTYGGVISR